MGGIIKQKYGLDATAVGDEGGFAPNFQNNGEALELLVEAIKKSGYEGKIKIGMDIAASEFYKNGKYDLDFKNPDTKESDWISSDKLGEMYKGFIKDYPVVSIEDPFDQDDWEGYKKLTSGTNIQIVGDDLLVTNAKRIQTAIDKKACNALLLKVNQIGSVTESIRAHQMAKGQGWGTMCPTGQARPRTVSLPTSSSASALGRSGPALPAAPSDLPSTTSFSGSRRSSGPAPSLPASTSVSPSRGRKTKNIRQPFRAARAKEA